MHKNKNCCACNINLDKGNYEKDRTVCKDCYNIKKKQKYNEKTLIQNQQPKIEIDNNKIRTLIIGYSNCGKTYLTNHFLLQKQEPIFVITKSLNQYTNIEAQTSDEIQPVNEFENSTVVFDDTLLSKHESNTNLFFTRGRHKNIDFHYISQSYFYLPKNTTRNNSNINILFKQTLKDIIPLFLDIAGLDMNLEEWKQLWLEAWENEYEYLQIVRFAKTERSRHTIRNCNKNTYKQCNPETKPF